MAAVWAVAATALGVIALIQANKDDEAGKTQSAADLARVQKDLSGRIDDLKAQVDELPTSDDLSKLDGRIKDVEKKADSTGSDIDKLNGRVDDLEKRVDDLESRQQTADEHDDHSVISGEGRPSRDAPQFLLDSTGFSTATGGTTPGQICRRCLGLDSA